jgi:hypothetical protein
VNHQHLFTAALGALIAAFSAQAGNGRSAEVPLDQPYPGTLALTVDLRDVTRKIFRVRETIPVKAGALTLYYPKWIPGEHGPTGTIDGVTGLKINAGGRPLEWRRDLEDPFSLRLDVPTGVSSLDLEFQFLSPGAGGAFGGSDSVTPR